MQLTLVRHGQSVYNFENLFTGCADVPLTETGKEEAQLAGKKLKGMVYDIAYTSLLERADNTLQIILEELGQTTIPVIRDKALNERGFGDLQGMDKEESKARFGEEQVLLWRRGYDVRPPGGESMEDTVARAVAYYSQEIKPKLLSGKNILIVAHTYTLRALVMHLENIDKEEISKVHFPNGLPRLYKFDSGFNIVDVAFMPIYS